MKKWSIDASVPTNFNSVVWWRIEACKRVSVAEAIRQWLAAQFARPAVAAAYLSIAVAAGLAAAHVQSSNVLRDRDSELEARYVQSVDPYAIRLTK